MTKLLASKIKLRAPFALKSLPSFSRFHRAVIRIPRNRKAELLQQLPLEKLFSLYYRLNTSPASGELVYQGPQGPKTLTYNPRNLAFDMFYGEAYADNYEDETGVLMDMFLPADGCLYDVGSNFGFFSLYFASRGGKGTAHAFEPIPSTFADLQRCVTQAGLTERVHCHNMAASDADGEVEFQLPLHCAGARVGSGGHGVKVRTCRLDSLKAAPPDFMKLDAEGHEAAVLRGALGLLRAHKPFVMFESKLIRSELPQSLEPMVLLQQEGYCLFAPTVLRKAGGNYCLLPCGYQDDLRRNLRIEPEDTMVLVPFDPPLRGLLPANLNLFACHKDRLPEVEARFKPLSVPGAVA